MFPRHEQLDALVGQVIYAGGGSGKTIYYTYGWQLNASGLYQLPGGFDLAGNLFGRQGYPLPLYQMIQLGSLEGNERVLVVDDITANRMPTLWNVDVRLAKRIVIGGRRGVTLGLDMFNVLNNNK